MLPINELILIIDPYTNPVTEAVDRAYIPNDQLDADTNRTSYIVPVVAADLLTTLVISPVAPLSYVTGMTGEKVPVLNTVAVDDPNIPTRFLPLIE